VKRMPLPRKTYALLLLLLVAVFGPSAWGSSVSFNLNNNNLGISGSVGTVTITDSGMNQVTVSITMNAGFSIKLEGGDVGFTGVSNLSAGSISNITATAGTSTFTGLSFQNFFSSKNISEFGKNFGDFADYQNLKGAGGGVVSADKLTFVLTASGLSAGEFTGVGIHFCTASGTNCGPKTGFAAGGAVTPTVIPEPGTMMLLGSGLVGMAAIVRRRIRSSARRHELIK
jgi:hypothetical protein